MTEEFVAQHKAKHLLAHVLVEAGARRWPDAPRGDSRETPTGFYADFGLAGAPTEDDLLALTDDMCRRLRTVKAFDEIELTRAESLERFGGHAWKLRQVEAITETDAHVRCYILDGFLDVCDCAIKHPRELQALHPEKFLLTGAHPVVWSHRGRDELFIRIRGEIFPTPEPCDCC